MELNKIVEEMIQFSHGTLHDTHHFMNVLSYARLIALGENVSLELLEIIELAAITHDIGCPYCREHFGHINGKDQEREGAILVREFLTKLNYPKNIIERIAYLVGHHHTLNEIDGMDYQILVEADYFVNAFNNNYSIENVKNMLDKVFKTKTGSDLLKTMYHL